MHPHKEVAMLSKPSASPKYSTLFYIEMQLSANHGFNSQFSGIAWEMLSNNECIV